MMRLLYITGVLFSVSVQAAGPARQTLPPVDKPFAASAFVLPGEDGKTYRLADFRDKLVIITFWATWCPPCRYEMPSLERAWQKLKDRNVIVLGVNVGEDADTLFEFTGSYPMSFPIPMDREGKVVKNYPIVGLPTTYIISPAGMVTHRAVGSREWDTPALLKTLSAMAKVKTASAVTAVSKYHQPNSNGRRYDN